MPLSQQHPIQEVSVTYAIDCGNAGCLTHWARFNPHPHGGYIGFFLFLLSFFKKNFFFYYGWFTMSGQLLLKLQNYLVIHLYTLFFSHYSLSCSITSHYMYFPVLYSRIHWVFNLLSYNENSTDPLFFWYLTMLFVDCPSYF